MASRSALYLSVAIVASAAIVTIGRVYQSRSGGDAPVPLAAPPTRVMLSLAPPPPSPPASPPQRRLRPCPRRSWSLPSSTPARRRGPTRSRDAGAVMAATAPCVAPDHIEHHVRLRVNYDPSGRPTHAEVRGVFATPPTGECIEHAALSVPLAASERGTPFLDYVFIAPVSSPR